MDYGERMGLLLSNIENLTKMSTVLDSNFIEKVEGVSSSLAGINGEQVEKIIIASEKIEKNRRDVLLVENGLSSIRRVVEMQNQVQYVSDARQNIGLVAGSLDSIKEVAEDIVHIRAASAMKPMIDETLALSTKMDAVLDMEEDIEAFMKTADRMELVLAEINQNRVTIQSELETSANILNAVSLTEKRISEKLATVESMVNTLQTFRISVDHLGESDKAYNNYDHENNILTLGVPRGMTGPRGQYKGDRGEPGLNGKDFSADYKGLRRERGKYCNYPVGTSYLSLDEIPTMIYFRKSNQNDDWTDGQPFGVGGEFYGDGDTSIVNGINVQRLTDQVMYELDKRQRIING